MHKDIILKFYSTAKRKNKPSCQGLDGNMLSGAIMLNSGLGDCIISTNLPKKIYNTFFKKINLICTYSNSEVLLRNNPYINTTNQNNNILNIRELENFDFGGGHIIQRMQRALNVSPDLIPKGDLYIKKNNTTSKKIALCFSLGNSGDVLKPAFKFGRELFPNNIRLIQELINDYNSIYDFVEIGNGPQLFSKTENYLNESIDKTIEKLHECSYFIGLNSGLMHAAAALEIPSIIIVDVPNANELYLPCLKDIDAHDINWLYPQNVHLHQSGENLLVPKFNLENLKKAINGEVYPFFDNKKIIELYD